MVVGDLLGVLQFYKRGDDMGENFNEILAVCGTSFSNIITCKSTLNGLVPKASPSVVKYMEIDLNSISFDCSNLSSGKLILKQFVQSLESLLVLCDSSKRSTHFYHRHHRCHDDEEHERHRSTAACYTVTPQL